MKNLYKSILSGILTWVFFVNSTAQHTTCENLNFSMGNFTNWTGYTWLYSSVVPSINTSKKAGIISRRQTIISDTTAYDANTGYALRKVPPGYRYSARLGDEIKNNSDSNPRCWEQSLQYTMTIDSSNCFLVIRFALVLQYASDHSATNEPRFRFTLFDSKGDTIPDCSNYDVYSSNKNVSGFHTYTPAQSQSPVMWRDWTTVGADLSGYIGHRITIEFMAADCTHKYHYGYAYFVAECHPMNITVNYCGTDSTASLQAPEGFDEYVWTDETGNTAATTQLLQVSLPDEGMVYQCTMTSATGCTVFKLSEIVKYIPLADYRSYMIDCFSNIVQLVNTSTTTHGKLEYQWDFGDGNTSEEENPRYTFSTSGMHAVSLILTNPPSSCTDTLHKDVESFSPPLVGIAGDTTYCPGLGVYLAAYGAWQYTWSTGSASDSTEIREPGGTIWMIGHSSTGCVSDTVYRSISEEPDWPFELSGDSVLCRGRQIELVAFTRARVQWNTGDITDTISVSKQGVYKVTATNLRGCRKSDSLTVKVYPIPDPGFSVSPSTLDIRHNQLTLWSHDDGNVAYSWDLGDRSTDTGPTVIHTYVLSNTELAYIVKLLAINSYGCADSAKRIIDVVPFVPNVFTPNGDGINDLFMPLVDIAVMDRNGLLLYSGQTGWDGTYHGRPADADTYYYTVYYEDRNQSRQTLKGFVTLIR
jgi:gliding motility-associated-like protein